MDIKANFGISTVKITSEISLLPLIRSQRILHRQGTSLHPGSAESFRACRPQDQTREGLDKPRQESNVWPMATILRTVAIVEDDSELRDSIRTFVEEAGWKLTGVFSNAEKALPVLEKEVPDIILMDIQLPGASGIELARHLKGLHEDVAILMLTVYDKTELVFEAISAGASGYLLKRDVPIRLLESMEEVLGGHSPVSSSIARKIFQHFNKQESSESKIQEEWQLTNRERDIVEGLVKGFLYKEIANDLDISLDTVRFHLRNIYKKLHVTSRTEAVVKYLS